MKSTEVKLRCQMVSGWMENGNHCQYVELRRGPKLIQTALIKQMKPDSIYKISIAKIYKDENGKIISSSNPVEKQIKTLTKNEEKCWDENTVSFTQFQSTSGVNFRFKGTYVDFPESRSNLISGRDIDCMCRGDGIGVWYCCDNHQNCETLETLRAKQELVQMILSSF